MAEPRLRRRTGIAKKIIGKARKVAPKAPAKRKAPSYMSGGLSQRFLGKDPKRKPPATRGRGIQRDIKGPSSAVPLRTLRPRPPLDRRPTAGTKTVTFADRLLAPLTRTRGEKQIQAATGAKPTRRPVATRQRSTMGGAAQRPDEIRKRKPVAKKKTPSLVITDRIGKGYNPSPSRGAASARIRTERPTRGVTSKGGPRRRRITFARRG